MQMWPVLAALLCFAGGGMQAEPFPRSLVTWLPDARNPVFTGTGADTWDSKIRERGWILRVDGTYYLWYTGYNDARSSSRFLGLATSRDGIHWERDAANPLTKDGWVEDVCVVHADGAFFMFAEGKDDVAHMLTSPDGRSWTERGPLDIRTRGGSPIAPGPRGTPTVWVEGKTWHLFYERSDAGVWLATSTDRRVWTNVRDEPILRMGPDAYDRYAVAFDHVFKQGDVYYALYHANAHKPWKPDWTTCLARSRDLVHWEKYAGNPIISGGNPSSAIVVETPAGARIYTMHPDVRVFSPLPPAQR